MTTEILPFEDRILQVVTWLDLIDQFAAEVDPTYTLPRDEIQRDLGNLLEVVRAARGFLDSPPSESRFNRLVRAVDALEGVGS